MLAPTMTAEFLSTSASYAKLAQDFRARAVAFATLVGGQLLRIREGRPRKLAAPLNSSISPSENTLPP
jgi:hypothetical protein